LARSLAELVALPGWLTKEATMSTQTEIGSPAKGHLRRHFWQRLGFQEAVEGYTFALPAILGLLIFTIGPIVVSLYFSFTEYNIVKPPEFKGLANYQRLFSDGLAHRSLAITAYYAFLAIPLSILIGFLIALLMNQKVRGVYLYRTIWYLPALVPAVATGTLWRYALNRDFGLVNIPFRVLGLDAPGWLIDPRLTVPALVLIHLWGLGNAVLIYLAGLQGIPQHLYEAAEIDGANWWQKFWHVTVPMSSSIIFFNLIMGIIGALQVFTEVYVIFTPTGGEGSVGPQNAALVYLIYLYRNAFQYFRMGYAAALAWVLFLIIGILTALMFRLQRRWVYYEGERAR